MTNRRHGRELALRILYGWTLQGGDLETQLGYFLEKYPYKSVVKEFSEKLVNGVRLSLKELDDIIGKNITNWDLDRVNNVDKNILRIGLYEFLYQDDIPCSVTIDEAVEIAKRYGDDDSGRFINAVLDKIRIKTGCGKRKTESN